MADKCTLKKTIRKCENCTDVLRGGGTRNLRRAPEEKGDTDSPKSRAKYFETSGWKLHRNNRENTRRSFYTNRLIDTRRSHQSWKYPALQRQNDLLEPSRWHFRESRFVKRIGRRRSAPRLRFPLCPRSNWNAIQCDANSSRCDLSGPADRMPYLIFHGTAPLLFSPTVNGCSALFA